jgi:crossover junction endodeoxyribonuclease RuvC
LPPVPRAENAGHRLLLLALRLVSADARQKGTGNMIVAGIDPGKGGCLVVTTGTGVATAYRVPVVKLPKETPAWSEWARTWSTALAFVDLIVIEQVGAMPTQGVVSMFNFGRVLGFVHALAAASENHAPVHFVTPAVWKNKFGLLKADKSASREKARTLLPLLEPELRRVKDDGVAEAALLAYYGRKYL